MFSPLVDPAIRSLDAIRKTLRTSHAVFTLKSSFVADGTALSHDMEGLFSQVPALTESRVYEHCSAVSRAYAVYESFIEELISAWLDYVPKIWANYLDVDENVRSRHREGVAAVLARLHHRRYEHLNERDVAIGFAGAFTSSGSYKLLSEAFIHRESNLRFDTLCNVFAGAGVGGVSGWKMGGDSMSSFLSTAADPGDTLPSLLDELVGYRNDASHGGSDEILSFDRLIFFCDFIERLIVDLNEFMAGHALRALLGSGAARKIGKVAEIFPRAQAVVAIVENAQVGVGDSLFLLTKNGGKRLTITSVMWHGTRVSSISAAMPVEVGLAFSQVVSTKGALVQISPSR